MIICCLEELDEQQLKANECMLMQPSKFELKYMMKMFERSCNLIKI